MESKRQKKFSSLLQQDLGEIFQQLRGQYGNAFITVTQVRVSPDLKIASVYLSFMLVNDPEATLLNIEESKGLIRQRLGQRIRNQVKSVPDLRFFLDDTEQVAQQVEKLFEKIDIPSEDKGQEGGA